MYDKYVQVLAKCAAQVFQKMTGKAVMSAKSEIIETAPASYPMAIMISYEHKGDRELEGHFLLGLSDDKIALDVAAGVVEQFGLPAPSTLDETALDALGEFVNTVVGRTISLWDRLDMPVTFGPPSALQQVEVSEMDGYKTTTYLITLAQALSSTSFVVTFTEPEPEKAVKARVLLAEDSKLLRGVLAKTLLEDSYEVYQADDGAQAIKLFKEHQPDICLMDLVMPNMGGLEAMMAIRELAPSAKLIVLTSSQRRDEMVSAKTIGVCAYLLKPVQPAQLLATVQKCLPKA